jgi:hypothetical protein
MIDVDKVWMVPENDKEIERAKNLIDNPDEYSTLGIRYSQLKELLILDYLQIGNYDGKYDDVLGYIELHNYKFSVKDFNSKITINNKYFRPFFKYLIKGLKLKSMYVITFYYAKNRPVVVEVEGKKGIIAYAYYGE